ncbi:MAG: Hsp20/alpha crystallin family protein [Haloarculaceae archaeon]
MTTDYTPFEQMDRLFEQMRQSMLGRDVAGAIGEGPTDVSARVEAVDDGYLVLADLPGFEREEIDLRFEDGTLTITAEHEVSDDEEYRSRRVYEQVSIPAAVRTEDATASYRNGVLEVHLPADADEFHRIDIE